MSLIIALYVVWLHGMLVVVIDRMRMITWLHGVWFVEIYKALHGMWFVVLNANFIRSYHFHPYPSPRPGKCCHLKKRRKIALCGRIALFYLHMIPYGVIFFIIEQKFENDRPESIVQNLIVARCALHDIIFLLNHIYICQ